METENKEDKPITEPVEDVENGDQEKKKKKKKNKKKAAGAAVDDYDAELAKVCDEQKVEEEAKAPEDGAEGEEGGEGDAAKKKKKRSKYINFEVFNRFFLFRQKEGGRTYCRTRSS